MCLLYALDCGKTVNARKSMNNIYRFKHSTRAIIEIWLICYTWWLFARVSECEWACGWLAFGLQLNAIELWCHSNFAITSGISLPFARTHTQIMGVYSTCTPCRAPNHSMCNELLAINFYLCMPFDFQHATTKCTHTQFPTMRFTQPPHLLTAYKYVCIHLNSMNSMNILLCSLNSFFLFLRHSTHSLSSFGSHCTHTHMHTHTNTQAKNDAVNNNCVVFCMNRIKFGNADNSNIVW